MVGRSAVVLFVGLAFSSPASAYTLSDSLKDGAPKGKAVGGSYGPSGWTVTGKADRIYYVVPRLVQGSIEFTASNITTSNLSLSDHEIFAMYDGGYGIPEPINYNPEFRDNHYKQLIRVYGQMVPDRLGEQKFIMLMCPDGAPGYGQCKCSKSYYDGDGWWGGNPTWDGSATKIKVEWGNGKATYSRDGVAVWTNDYSSTGLVFGPSELHFTIGCPRNSAIADAGMPIGAVFSDVLVQGTEGPLATCGGTGAGGSGGTGGTSASGGTGGCDPVNPIAAVSLTPVSGAGPADVFVAQYAHCEGAAKLRVVQLLVGEPIAGQPYVAPAFESGKLYLGTQSCAPGEAKVLSDPLGTLDCAKTSVATSGNQTTVSWALAFDVSKFAGLHGVWLDAKGGSVTPEPRLGWTKLGEYTVQAGSSGGSGGSGWSGSGGTLPNAGGAGGAGQGGTEPVEGEGCGCRAPGSRSSGAGALLIALGALLGRRARRR